MESLSSQQTRIRLSHRPHEISFLQSPANDSSAVSPVRPTLRNSHSQWLDRGKPLSRARLANCANFPARRPTSSTRTPYAPPPSSRQTKFWADRLRRRCGTATDVTDQHCVPLVAQQPIRNPIPFCLSDASPAFTNPFGRRCP